jgi:hypothetical protein
MTWRGCSPLTRPWMAMKWRKQSLTSTLHVLLRGHDRLTNEAPMISIDIPGPFLHWWIESVTRKGSVATLGDVKLRALAPFRKSSTTLCLGDVWSYQNGTCVTHVTPTVRDVLSYGIAWWNSGEVRMWEVPSHSMERQASRCRLNDYTFIICWYMQALPYWCHCVLLV